VVELPAQMGGEDFSQFGLAGVRAVLLHVGAVDAAKLEASHKSGVPVPGLHSPLWAPEREPTIKAAIRRKPFPSPIPGMFPLGTTALREGRRNARPIWVRVATYGATHTYV